MNTKLWIVCGLMAIVAGCRTTKNIKPEKIFAHQQVIAKFTDIPDAPFQLTLQDIATSDADHQEVQCVYSCTGPLQDVIDFYQQQMERLGWQLLAQCHARDYLAHFSKPGRLCSLLIAGNQVSLFMSSKKGA